MVLKPVGQDFEHGPCKVIWRGHYMIYGTGENIFRDKEHILASGHDN